MKNCTDCKYADWKRTKSGRLHPDGGGRCTYQYKLPPLPASRMWMYGTEPKPSGGHIERRIELANHCPYFARD